MWIIVWLKISIVCIVEINKVIRKLIKGKLLIKVTIYMYYNINIRLFSYHSTVNTQVKWVTHV